MTYPRLHRANAALRDDHGVPAWDLTGALDDRDPGEEFYLDFCHVNHAANRRLAQALAPAVLAALGRGSP